MELFGRYGSSYAIQGGKDATLHVRQGCLTPRGSGLPSPVGRTTPQAKTIASFVLGRSYVRPLPSRLYGRNWLAKLSRRWPEIRKRRRRRWIPVIFL